MSPTTQPRNDIAELAALGFTNGEIAIRLNIAPAAVRAELEALHRLAASAHSHGRDDDVTGTLPRKPSKGGTST